MITCVGEDLDVFSDMLDTIKIGQLEKKVRPKFLDKAKKTLLSLVRVVLLWQIDCALAALG